MSLEVIIPLGVVLCSFVLGRMCCFKDTLKQVLNFETEIVQTSTDKSTEWPCGSNVRIVRKSTFVSEENTLSTAHKWINKNPEKVLIEINYWFNPSVFSLSGGYWTITEWELLSPIIELKKHETQSYRTLMYCRNNCVARVFLNTHYNL